MKATPLDLRHKIALDINAALQGEVRAHHPLEQLFWECTLRCNLACRHCGSDCKAVAQTPDMPREDFFRVLDDVNAHCTVVDYTIDVGRALEAHPEYEAMTGPTAE